MMDIVKLLREAGYVYHDIARDMLQNEWKEHLAPHYTQRGDELKLAAAELEAQEPVAYRYEFANPISGGRVWRHSAASWNGQTPRSSEPLYRHPPSAVPEGLERAAQHIEKKAETYDFEHGSTDPDTGSREYPGDGADYYNNLMELAEEIRLLATTGDSHK